MEQVSNIEKARLIVLDSDFAKLTPDEIKLVFRKLLANGITKNQLRALLVQKEVENDLFTQLNGTLTESSFTTFEFKSNKLTLKQNLELLITNETPYMKERPYFMFKGSEFSNGYNVNLGDKIIVKKGLILYHMTANTKENRFKYPKGGSFYSYTPMHPMVIIDDFNYDSIYYYGYEGRLIKYILKKDLSLRVEYGDAHECRATFNKESDYTNRKDDGAIVAGYSQPGYSPVDEILLCDDGEKILEFIDEIVFDKDFLDMMLSFRMLPNDEDSRQFTGLGSIREFSYPLPIICPNNDILNTYKSIGYQLSYISDISGAVYVFEFLREKLPFPYRLMLFDTQVNIYVISNISNIYDIQGLVLVSVTLSNPNLKNQRVCTFGKLWKNTYLKHSEITWPLVKFLLEFVVNKSHIIDIHGQKSTRKCKNLIFAEEDIIELTKENIYIENYINSSKVEFDKYTKNWYLTTIKI